MNGNQQTQHQVVEYVVLQGTSVGVDLAVEAMRSATGSDVVSNPVVESAAELGGAALEAVADASGSVLDVVGDIIGDLIG